MDWNEKIDSELQEIDLDLVQGKGVKLYLLREDRIHAQISGNKWRKLKYHILHAQASEKQRLVTFGGAYSNHIAATAYAAAHTGLSSLGVIRGEELSADNPTLQFAKDHGMELRFVSRSRYRDDKTGLVGELATSQTDHIVPEGGADELGVKGCEEILDSVDVQYDIVACSAGTGTTAAGILRSLPMKTMLRVYSALKGDFLEKEIKRLSQFDSQNIQVTDDYCFGGYARTHKELFEFISHVSDYTGVKLDPVYTGKMLFGVVNDINTGLIPEGSTVVAIHTGGLQGVRGIEIRDKVTLFRV